MMALPLLALAVMGIAIVRSAYLHRQGNWVIGMIVGGLFVFVGAGGVLGILFL